MPLEVLCSRCQGRLLVEKAGVVVACPMCGTHLMVPLPKPAAPQASYPPVPPQTAALKPTPRSPTAKSNDSLKPMSDSIPDWLQAAQNAPPAPAPAGGVPSGFPQFGSNFPSPPPSAPSPFPSILTAPAPPPSPPVPAPAPVAQVAAPPAPTPPPAPAPASQGLPFSFPGAGSPAPFPAAAQPETPFSFSFDQLTASPPPAPAPSPPPAPTPAPAPVVSTAQPVAAAAPPPAAPAPVSSSPAPAPLAWSAPPMLQVTIPLAGEAATVAPMPATLETPLAATAEPAAVESSTGAAAVHEALQPVDPGLEAAPPQAVSEMPTPAAEATLESAPPDPWATQPGMAAIDSLTPEAADDATVHEALPFEPAAASEGVPAAEATESFAATTDATEFAAAEPAAASAHVEEAPAVAEPAAEAATPAVETVVPSEPSSSPMADAPSWMTAATAPTDNTDVVDQTPSAETSEVPPPEEIAPAATVAGETEAVVVDAPVSADEASTAEPATAWEQPAEAPASVEQVPPESVAPTASDLAAQAAMMAAAAAAPVGMGAPVTVAVATTIEPAATAAEPPVAAPAAAAPSTAPSYAAAPVAAAMAAPVAAEAVPADAVVAAVPAEAAPAADAGFLASPASMTAAPAARPAGRSLPRHVTVSQLWFVMILSYASAITVMILYLVFGAKFGTSHQLESLPDVVPKETPAGKIRTELVSQAASMPPGHTLKLGQTERYGNLRVTPLRVVREPIEFSHYSDAGTKKPPGETVLKLWMRFENVSKDQEFSPLGKELLFARHQTAMDRGRDRSNTFVCPLAKKRQASAAVLVYQHSFNDVWDLKDLKIDHWIPPGETFETYIPTDPAGIDQLTGELVWRVHFRKGLNAKSGRGVTTMIEVVFNSDQIEAPGKTSEPAAEPPATPEKKDPPAPTKA